MVTVEALEQKLQKAKQRKEKKREKKAKAKFEKKREVSPSKKVSFGLEQNKVKEFYLHGKLNTTKQLVSKDRKPTSPSIIKRT